MIPQNGITCTENNQRFYQMPLCIPCPSVWVSERDFVFWKNSMEIYLEHFHSFFLSSSKDQYTHCQSPHHQESPHGLERPNSSLDLQHSHAHSPHFDKRWWEILSFKVILFLLLTIITCKITLSLVIIA